MSGASGAKVEKSSLKGWAEWERQRNVFFNRGSAAVPLLGTNEVLNLTALSLPTLVYLQQLVLMPVSQQKSFA